jgi:hypothetical protein
MRKVSGFLAVASFFWLYGTIGAVEQDMLSLGTGTIHMILALACFYVFCKLAGVFYPTQKKKSRSRCSRPKSGKRKCSI